MSESAPTWRPFDRVPNANAIAAAIDTISPQVALTPLRDKRPYRADWNHEPPVDRATIRHGILHGHTRISERTGNPYRMFDSGFGIRTGDISGGILAIDVDGEQAEALLLAISGGDIPPTWQWSSGKPGRYQLGFQIPPEIIPYLTEFQRHVLREFNGITSSQDLDFRYNETAAAPQPAVA